MANKTYPPGAGDVLIELGNQKLLLRPTMGAGFAISRVAGGIRGAISKVVDFDLDTILTVIRAGLGPKEAKNYPHLDKLVFENGLMDEQGALTAKLVDFLGNLARGGRPTPEPGDREEEGQDEPDPRPQS